MVGQNYVLEFLISVLKSRDYRGTAYVKGDIYWNVGSLHVYENQFYLIENYIETGIPWM